MGICFIHLPSHKSTHEEGPATQVKHSESMVPNAIYFPFLSVNYEAAQMIQSENALATIRRMEFRYFLRDYMDIQMEIKCSESVIWYNCMTASKGFTCVTSQGSCINIKHLPYLLRTYYACYFFFHSRLNVYMGINNYFARVYGYAVILKQYLKVFLKTPSRTTFELLNTTFLLNN